MFDIPAFFIDQQIDQDADERTIKRAYAKALKLIDQDNDLAGFQELRESYERALAWARSKEWREQYIAEQNADDTQLQDATTSDTAVVPSPTDEAVFARVAAQEVLAVGEPSEVSQAAELSPDSASQAAIATADPEMALECDASKPIVYAIDVARAIFDEFLQTLAEKSEEAGQTEIVLRAYLDDDRLINVEIRDLFEWLIAERLAQGWQSGNGDLFGASVKCFGWNQDRNRLLRFQEFGYYLDRAVDEMSAFNLQEEARSNRQVNLIRLARNDAPPTKQFLRENIYFINDMMASYPTWLAMVTKFENLETWHKRAEEYQFFQPPKLDFGRVKDKFESFSFPPGVIVFIVFILIKLMMGFSGSNKEPDVIDTRTSEAAPKILSSEELFERGELYFKPQFGGARDIDLAEVFWKRAAELGSRSAQLRLQELYSSDLFSRKNLQEYKKYSDMLATNKALQ